MGHPQGSESSADMSGIVKLENKGRAPWGRTRKLRIPKFKSLCWRQAGETWLDISNAHQFLFQKVIFVVIFALLGGFLVEWQYQTLREAVFLYEND